MKGYSADRIRNIGLFSHGGAGKTTLTEAMLYGSKAISRLGRVDEGTTTADFDPDEIKRRMSVSLSLAPCEWNATKINIVDAPGYADFVGEIAEAMRAIDTAVILIDATGGVEVGTEQVWQQAAARNIPRILFINKLDRENANFENVLAGAKASFGGAVVALHLPIGHESGFSGMVDLLTGKAYMFSLPSGGSRDASKVSYSETDIPADMQDAVVAAREQLVERVVEADDDLMTRYLDGQTIANPELAAALAKGVAAGTVVPVLVGSALNTIGATHLLDVLVAYAPSPAACAAQKGTDGEAEVSIACDSADVPTALVFKTSADQFGKQTFLRVYSGALKSDSYVRNSTKGKDERLGTLYFMRGKEQVATDHIEAGDIGIVLKMAETTTGDTLTAQGGTRSVEAIQFPAPLFSAAIHAKNRADLDKLGIALQRIVEEDPTLHVSKDPLTGETILAGMGESHIQIAADRMARKFGVNITSELPRVPYRETIMGSAKAEFKHKKQTGGHGQYGHVHLEVSADPEHDFAFSESVVGGVVPRNFIPAVEKGVREALGEGIQSGFPVINIRVNLYDGSYHPVDSSEMAFKIAAAQAFKKGCMSAKPTLLEPLMNLEIVVPESYVGDVMSDMNTRRGRVLGMDPKGNGFTTITAQAPLSEVQRYATDLRSMTQGRGTFSQSFAHYEQVPQQVAEQIIVHHRQETEAATH